MKKAVVIGFESGKFRAVALVNKNNRIEITRTLVRDYQEGELSAAWLQSAWTEGGFSDAKAIVMLPHHAVGYKSVLVPPLPKEQLPLAARMELENGGSGSSSAYQYRIIYHQNDAAGMVSVKLAVIPDAELLTLTDLFHQAGIRISWFGFHWRGLQNFVNFHRDDRDQPGGALFLDIAAKSCELTAIDRETIRFHREFSPGAAELIQNKDADLEDFCQEIRLSQAAFQGLDLPAGWSEPVWGFGPLAILEQLAEMLPVMNAVNVRIPVKTSLAGLPQESETGENQVPELAALIGLGLEGIGWATGEDYQILSREGQKQKNRQVLLRGAAGYILAGMLIAAGLFFGLQAQYERNHKVSAWLKLRTDTLIQLRRASRETERDLAVIRNLENQRRHKIKELEFLLALQNTLPEGTLIKDLTLENGVVKDLSGVTPAVSTLMRQIKKSPLLRNLLLKGTVTVTPEGEVFHLEGPMETPGELRTRLANPTESKGEST